MMNPALLILDEPTLGLALAPVVIEQLFKSSW
jgi:ABC-type branched-subunit amino acid transport system ATPase component